MRRTEAPRHHRHPAWRAALTALLLAASAPAVRAQQPRDTARTASDDSARASRADTTAGPRRTTEWQPFRPSLMPRAARSRSLPADGTTTIRISTLALILIGVIVVLLIVR